MRRLWTDRRRDGRNPDVHHITPVKWFIASDDHNREDAHYIENVISLCISCHRKVEFGKIAPEYLRSLVEDPVLKPAVAELQAEADRRQMDDPAYRKELGHWVGIGALGSAWLPARIGQAVLTHLDVVDGAAATRFVGRFREHVEDAHGLYVPGE